MPRIAIALVVVLVAVSLLAKNAFASDATAYRTATVEKRDVNSVLTGVGTIEPVSQATVAFPVSGTVKTVDVEVGDTVTAGQQLATLDTQSLDATLHQAEATLAEAKLTLQKALNGESVSAGSGNPQGQAKPTAATSSTSTVELTAASLGSTNAEVAAAQQRVLKAQQRVDAALAASDTATQSANTVCSAAGVGSAATKSSTTTSSTTAASEAASDAEPVGACKTALEKVQIAQGEVTAAQKDLSAASTQLDGLLAQQGSATSSTGANPSPSGGGATGSSSTSGSSPSSQSSPSSADLVNYQKQVDAAQAEVTVAEQAVAQATIVSPIAGQVVAVNLATGDSVTSGSSSQNIVIKGAGGYEATTSISVDRISDVTVGQAATVHADGISTPMQGTVVSISNAPDSSTSSSTKTYRVTVALANPNAELRDGGTATISIITKRATSALAVPTSAVVASGTRRSVTVVDGSSTRQVQVGVGVIGETWTQVTGGLTEGQSVVLATVTKPLPDSATSSSSNSGIGGIGRGGGGGFPAFPGGGQ